MGEICIGSGNDILHGIYICRTVHVIRIKEKKMETLATGTIIMLAFIAALFVFSCYLVWLNIKNNEEIKDNE